MESSMRATLRKIRDMAMEYLCGEMDEYMMDNGETESSMDEEYLRTMMDQKWLGNGSMVLEQDGLVAMKITKLKEITTPAQFHTQGGQVSLNLNSH